MGQRRRFYNSPLVFDAFFIAIGAGMLLYLRIEVGTSPIQPLQLSSPEWSLILGWWSLIAGVGGAFIYLASWWMNESFGLSKDVDRVERNRPSRELWFPPKLVGYCESALFPIALLLGQPGFIGVWLGVQVTGQWAAWQKGVYSRTRFQRFLINSSCSILVAVVIYFLVREYFPTGFLILDPSKRAS